MKKIGMIVLAVLFFNSLSIGLKTRDPHDIRTGFYLRWGPAIPMGKFATGQTTGKIIYQTVTVPRYDYNGYIIGYDTYNQQIGDFNYYYPARTGVSCELGTIFYTGPYLMKHRMRIGMDATFLNFWFMPSSASSTKYWCFFAGQKVGPVVTIGLVDQLMLDFGIKLVSVVGYTNQDEELWGRHVNEEIMINLKYRKAVISFQFDPGTINYTNFNNQTRIIDNSTFRILFGMKFR